MEVENTPDAGTDAAAEQEAAQAEAKAAEETARSEAKDRIASILKNQKDEELEPDTQSEEAASDDTSDEDDDDQPSDNAGKSTESAPAPVRFDEELLAHAMTLGLTLTEARSFDGNASLALFLQRIEKSRGMGEEKPEDEDELDPELFDERLVKPIKSIKGKQTEQDKRLAILEAKQAQDEAEKRRAEFNQQMAEVDKIYEEFDGAIDSLAKEVPEAQKLFGTGKFEKLDQRTNAFKARARLLKEMNAQAVGLRSVGEPVPSRSELFNRALRVMYPEIASLPRSTVKDKYQLQQSRMSARPGRHSGDSAVDLRRQAIAKIDAKLRETGD